MTAPSIFQDRKAAFLTRWSAFKRRTVMDAKELADEFEPIYSAIPHGQKQAWRDEIGMNANTAAQLVRIANEVEISSLSNFECDSWTDLVKSLPPKQANKAAPQPPPAGAQDSDQAAPAAATPEAAEVSEAEIDEFVSEEIAGAAAAAKDERDERLATRLDGQDLDAVEALSAQLDKCQAEARAQVIKGSKKIANRDKKLKAIRDDLLQSKPFDDILAVHFGVAQKTVEAEPWD